MWHFSCSQFSAFAEVNRNNFPIEFSSTFSSLPVTGSEDEERLVRDLFRGYNKLIRPVQNMTQKVDVRFGLAFVQLINVVSAKLRRKQFSTLIFPFSFVLQRTKRIRLWSRTSGCVWCGATTNCSGMRRITAASVC